MMGFNTVFKALSDPTRREILRLLSGGERTAGELASSFDMTKPSMSHHFTVLKEADLIRSRRDGQQIYYSLNTTVLEDVLTRLWDAAAIIAPAWLYPGLPDQIPTHWNIEGKVDGYGGKWTLFAFPGLMAGMLVLFYFLPALSPKHFEVDTFRPTYLYIMDIVLGLFAYMQGVLLYTVYQSVHAGASFDLGRGFMAGLFLFFALMGNQLGKVRKNFYIGVRVPWTLASDRVWNDTHRLAAWVMSAGGVIGFVLTVLGLSILVSIVILIVSALFPVVYSFVHYKALERSGQLEPSKALEGAREKEL
jgi:DNA-binding transcriptional ArsR family regulator/uncharacterized membrane protein